MKRLLFVLPSVPQPADSGAKLRNLAFLRIASELGYAVDALAFASLASGRDALAQLVDRAETVRLPARRGRARRALATMQSALPDVVEAHVSTDFASRLRCMLAETQYHAVQAEGLEMARYLKLVPPAQRIYDAHNPEFLLQRRAHATARSLLASVYSRLQWRRLERFELDVVRTSRLTLTVSEHDANQLLALAATSARIAVVPSAIDVEAYPFQAPAPDERPDLLFLGKLDYRPNAEAVQWLVQAVLPSVFNVLPDARLFVVGGNPPDWLVRVGQRDARVAVTGYVADERRYLARCSALLLPIRAGGGSRLKALIAMASGVPIISTRLGMEGLEAVPNEHFLCAESPGEWAHAVRRLFGDWQLRRNLAARARELVERRYAWACVKPLLAAAYAELDA